MSAPRFARGSKSRIFLYVGTVFLFGVAVCIIHETQVQLNESRKTAEKCQQQQESLSAQLQVIFEYKLRLEKSLQEEKALHRKTRQELESQVDTEKQVREKDRIESVNKFTSLQQQYKILQGQHEDLTEECNKVRQAQVVSAGERSRLETEVAAARQELEQVQAVRDKEIEAMKTQYLEVLTENDRLRKQYNDVEGQAQRSAAELNFLRKQNIQIQKELDDLEKALASCKVKNGEIVSGIINKPSVEISIPKDAASSKKMVSPSPPAPVVKSEDENAKNVLPQPVAMPHQVSSSTIHGGGAHSVTPKGKLAEDKVDTNNVIPVPPPQGEQQGAVENSERGERDQGVQPVDGVGARPDSHIQVEKDSQRDEEKVRDLDHAMEVGAGVGAAPDILKHDDENENKENAYQMHAMQWRHKPQDFEMPQQAVVPIPYAYENQLHQIPQKPYNSEILHNAIINRNPGHSRVFHQDLPRIQPPIPLPRSQHDQNAIPHHPLPLPNRKPIRNYVMKEVGHHNLPDNDEADHGDDEQSRGAAARWHIREQHPVGGPFPYHGIAGDYGRDEGEDGDDGAGGKVRAKVDGRGQWAAERKESGGVNPQEDLQLEEGDEDDEDVDQIDYGANEVAGAHVGDKDAKHHQALNMEDKKHESVMVNPK
ncbi:hypothetical protein J437_LFUL003212 [Ladona fulva]|uniref:Golgi integral membrane protein 4 n=1 Tax=Ladona fulva TaxID=123851 RepID=A0A8K0JYL9_LADFU|nr:hypothetical protein J437_LFUL003212 [Ladona fulva]